MKKLLILAFSLLSLGLNAQTTETTTTAAPAAKPNSRPNIPGTFVLEFGLNRVQNTAPNFKTGFFGSRALNIYYQYDIRILKSKFSFVPGIGFGLERYKFPQLKSREFYILSYDQSGVLAMQKSSTDLALSGVKKSQLVTNYLDVPLELRFSTRPDDPARSFKLGIGVRGGYLFNSHTKVKQVDNGTKSRTKVNENFNLNNFRYGVFAKIGGGNFSIFTYYNLSPLFKKGKGPADVNTLRTTEMSNFVVGISLSSF